MSWLTLDNIVGDPTSAGASKDNELECMNAGPNAAQITSVDVLSSGTTSSGIQAVTAKVCVNNILPEWMIHAHLSSSCF